VLANRLNLRDQLILYQVKIISWLDK